MIRIGVCGFLTAVVIAIAVVQPENRLVAAEPAAVPAKRWKQHSMTQPKPPVVAGQGSAGPAAVPADAVVLFDGKDLSQWVSDSGEPAGWTVRDGFFEVKPEAGSIRPANRLAISRCILNGPAPIQLPDRGRIVATAASS